MDSLVHSCRNFVVWESQTDILSEIKVFIPYGPAILLLGIHLRESLIHIHKETCPVTLHATSLCLAYPHSSCKM